MYSCISHKKLYGSLGGRGVRGKKPNFLKRKTYGKENPDSISKASTHDCGVGIYLYYIRCLYQIIWESLDVTWGATTKPFDGNRIGVCTLGPAHILVSSPGKLGRDMWAVLKRSFISQGRKELLTPPLTHRLRGHSASLRVEIPLFCLRASLRWLTHLKVLLRRTFLWPPPFLPLKGGL